MTTNTGTSVDPDPSHDAAQVQRSSRRRCFAMTEWSLEFTDRMRNQPNCVPIAPGARHWDIFTSLCRSAGAKGNLVPDAYLAALAIESGSEWITTDRDFSRFPGLRWRHPLTS
jgi:predicted nucleic acid-binding protein